MDKHALDGLALLHDLVPFLPVDRLFALLTATPLPDQAEGAALFADLSGFTALTEALSQQLGPERGAEEINQQLNMTFGGIIEAVSRFRGSVIRFSGDGLTAWFTGDQPVLRAAAAALAMQAFMGAVVALHPDLKLKIGIGAGPTRRFNVGDAASGSFDVLAGPAIQEMASAEQAARAGQIVLSPTASAAAAGSYALEPIPDGLHILKPTVFAPSDFQERWPPIRWMDHVDRAWDLVAACQPYLPAPIYQRFSRGHGAYMTELRLVTPLFVAFTGLDYDAPDAARYLDELVRTAQTIIQQNEGYLSEVGVGDKGSELVALFGAPVALENPALQAAYAANGLLQSLPHVQSLHIGLTCERLFTGMVGSPMRRAYTVIGNEVNLAARFMIRAAPGEVLANYRAHQMAHEFAWQALSPMRVKGKIAPVRVYRLLEPTVVTRPLWPAGRVVARQREVDALQWAVDTHQDGRARIVIISGRPGLGKSHLLSKFSDLLKARGVTGLAGSGHAIEQQTPYHAWRGVFQHYFGLSSRDPAPAKRQHVLSQLKQIAPTLVPRAPLLNDVLQLGLPENEFTETLEPAERHTMVANLLIGLLRAWLEEDALAIIIDNAQWMDALSWDLLSRIAAQVADLPLSILLATRPTRADTPATQRAIEALPHTHLLELSALNAEDAETLAAELMGVSRIPDPLGQILMQKTGGNPLFIKEVIRVLQESGMVEISGGEAVLKGNPAELKLPDTIQGIVRSRIDQLPPEQQTLLKVAAVLGPTFNYSALQAIQPLRMDEKTLRANLDALDSMDLYRVEDLPHDAVYAFRYAITRELAYDALPFSQRQQLHIAAAAWYEDIFREDLAPFYAMLVHHWHAAEMDTQERKYAYLAGLRAAERYANDDAIAYFKRALALTGEDHVQARFETLLRLEDLHNLGAMRAEQRHVLEALSLLAEAAQKPDWRARTAGLWARYYESIGEYSAAIEAADRAMAAAHQTGDSAVMGMSNVYRGLCLMRLGRYDEACAVLNHCHAPDDHRIEAWRLDVLGRTYRRMGHFSDARATFQQAQAHGNAASDRAAVGQILQHTADNFLAMADYSHARQFYERALQIRQAIGDRAGEAYTLSKLGQLALILGDHQPAQTYLEQTCAIFRAITNPAGEAEALHSIGQLQYSLGEYEQAQSYLRQALALYREAQDTGGARLSILYLALIETVSGSLHEAEALLAEAEQPGIGGPASALAQIQPLVAALAARIALLKKDHEAAAHHSDRLLALLDQRGLASVQDVFEIIHIAAGILAGIGRGAEANTLIQRACKLLTSRANRISDPEERTRYLLTVPSHRKIVSLCQELHRKQSAARNE